MPVCKDLREAYNDWCSKGRQFKTVSIMVVVFVVLVMVLCVSHSAIAPAF